MLNPFVAGQLCNPDLVLSSMVLLLGKLSCSVIISVRNWPNFCLLHYLFWNGRGAVGALSINTTALFFVFLAF